MSGGYDGLWFTTVIIGGAAGAAMLLYGIRQKEPLPLGFGIALSAVPVVIHRGWIAALVSIALGGLYLVAREYID